MSEETILSFKDRGLVIKAKEGRFKRRIRSREVSCTHEVVNLSLLFVKSKNFPPMVREASDIACDVDDLRGGRLIERLGRRNLIAASFVERAADKMSVGIVNIAHWLAVHLKFHKGELALDECKQQEGRLNAKAFLIHSVAYPEVNFPPEVTMLVDRYERFRTRILCLDMELYP